MTNKSVITFCICISSTFSSCGQTQSDRFKLGEEFAKEQLKIALSDSSAHNVINSHDLIIKDKETAINVVEPILFGVYGKENIIKQRPYETYLIDHYWIVLGTLPKKSVGGTFLIIVAATNSKIIRLTHGK
jgi:hypothetical protein